MRHGTRHPAWQQNEVPEPVAAPHRWNTTRRPSTAQWRWRTRPLSFTWRCTSCHTSFTRTPPSCGRWSTGMPTSLRPPFRREGLTQTQKRGMTFLMDLQCEGSSTFAGTLQTIGWSHGGPASAQTRRWSGRASGQPAVPWEALSRLPARATRPPRMPPLCRGCRRSWPPSSRRAS